MIAVRALREGGFLVTVDEETFVVDAIDVDEWTLDKLAEQITTRFGAADAD